MRHYLLPVLCALLSGCASSTLKTPLEINPKEPFVFHEYPEASVYRLLSAPRELDGARIRTCGYVEFYVDGSIAFLFPSGADARERLPMNFVELHFSDAIKEKEWFRRFSREKILFKGWIVGVFRIPSPSSGNQRLRLEDVTEFDVESGR